MVKLTVILLYVYKPQLKDFNKENGWGGINNHYEIFTLPNAGLGTSIEILDNY